jgi:hypothetical protein
VVELGAPAGGQEVLGHEARAEPVGHTVGGDLMGQRLDAQGRVEAPAVEALAEATEDERGLGLGAEGVDRLERPSEPGTRVRSMRTPAN